ncbi:MAG: DUF2147 domain-containing protein [Rhodothermaceae bacterium]|nr:DUF2147 domain-containing protein [Rhodothermaceae bacterium]
MSKESLPTVVSVLILLLFTAGPRATLAQSPIGFWQTIDDNTNEPRSIVEIYENDGNVEGRIVKLINPDEPNPVCDKCEGERNGQPIEGMVIIEDLTKDGNEWAGGHILDPENGKTYRCRIWVEEGTLRVRGYLAIFRRTQTWLPADNPG